MEALANSAPPARPRHPRKAYALLLLIVALEALLLLPRFRSSSLMGGDAHDYDTLARNVAGHGCYSLQDDCQPSYLRTPGYPLLLAAVYEAGGGVQAVRVVQFAIHLLTAILLYELAALYFTGATALLAALLYATFLPLVLSPLYHMPETLATAAAVATVWAASRINGWKWALIFGAAGGVAYLVRPTLVLLPVGLGIALLLARRASVRQMAIAALACAAVLAPWIARNSMLQHRLSVGSPPGWPVYISALQWQGRLTYHLDGAAYLPITVERERRVTALYEKGMTVADATAATDIEYFHRGMSEYRRIPLYAFAIRWPARMAHLWGPNDSELGLPFTFLFAPAQWVLLAVFCAGGIWRERRRLGTQCAAWTPVVCLSLFHTFFHIEPRYSLMGWPFLLVYSAVGLAAFAGTLHKRRPGMARSASASQ